MKPQLCLGTAQFGLAYGITNALGQVSESEVAQILQRAHQAGIYWLDTAQAYGNAEAVLGRQLPNEHTFKLVSKLPLNQQNEFTIRDVNLWEHAFHESCERLGQFVLDALLLHSIADLKKPGGHYLHEWLLGLRERGLVQRLGVSIYAASDLDGIESSLLDHVQLPLSLFDQRLLHDGTVARLRDQGIAVHARSVYLQGLLVTPAAYWPSWINAEARAHQEALEVMAQERGCELLDLALGFVQEQGDLEAVVMGVCSVHQLEQLLASWSARSPWQEGEWRTWALQEPSILDPRCWPR